MTRGLAITVSLLCTIFLMVQGTGAHEHLCFDGQEPAVSIHFGDGAEISPDSSDVQLAHHDLDVDLGQNSSSKLPKVDLPVLGVLFAALFIAFDMRGKFFLARSRSVRFRYRSPYYFSPPLRGPPSFSVR